MRKYNLYGVFDKALSKNNFEGKKQKNNQARNRGKNSVQELISFSKQSQESESENQDDYNCYYRDEESNGDSPEQKAAVSQPRTPVGSDGGENAGYGRMVGLPKAVEPKESDQPSPLLKNLLKLGHYDN